MLKSLLKCYEDVLKEQLECKNVTYSEFYNGYIAKPLKDIITTLVEYTKMSDEEILADLKELGACDKESLLNDMYMDILCD